MKTLQAWWNWYLNEKPDLEDVAWPKTYPGGTLTDTARKALWSAAEWVGNRAQLDTKPQTVHQYPEAVRDLSIELCRALEKMHEAVVETEKPLMWNDDKLHALAVADQPMLSAWHDVKWHDVNEKTAKALEAQMDAGMRGLVDRGMLRASMAELYESYKIEPIEIQLCPPCAELGCYSTTTLDMLCAGCQVKCGLEPKNASSPPSPSRA